MLNNRESAFYVDYVANDDGHVWTDPTQHDDLLLGPIEPWSLKMACALSDAGFASPEGLSIIAKTWRPASFDLTTGWEVFRGLNLRTLRALDTAGLLQPQPNDVYSHIVRNWQFPMYDLDVQMIPVELEVLREQQRNWSPDW